jgi:hypothetical protein
LVREKDLLEGLVVIASTPRLLDSLDVFCLRDGRTQSIRGTEEAYHVEIMNHGVLARKRETLRSNPLFLEHCSTIVKSRKCVVEIIKSFLRDYTVPHDVAELQESTNGTNYLLWKVFFDRGQVHLSKDWKQTKLS